MPINWELIPLLLMVFILPFFNGGEHEIIQIIWLAFPLFYLPILFSKPRKVSRSFVKIVWLWLLYLGVNIISTIDSASLALSVPQVMRLMGIFLYFVIFYLMVEKRKDIELIANILIGVGILLSLISFYFIAFPPPANFPGMNLVYAKYGHNHLSDYLLLVMPVVMINFLNAQTKRLELIWGLILIFLYLSFLLTFSRGGFLAMTVVVLWMIWRMRKTTPKVLNFTALVIVPVLLTAAALTLGSINKTRNIFSDKEVRSNWSLRQIVKPINVEGRFDYWKQAIEGFKLKPFLGTGPGTFRLTSKRFQTQPSNWSWYAHNSFLQVLSETGLIGIIVFGLLLIYTARGLNKDFTRLNKIESGLMLGAGGSLIQSLVDFNWDFLAIYILFWVMVACLLNGGKRSGCRMLRWHKVGIGLMAMIVFILAGLKGVSMAVASNSKAVKIFPFSESNWKQLLSELNQTASEEVINSALIFNSQSQDINSLLAEVLYQHRGVLAAKPIYKNLLLIYRFEIDKKLALQIATETEDRQVLDEIIALNKQFLIGEDLGLAKRAYFLGINLYHEGRLESAITLWQLAIDSAADWSYFYIELANLYEVLDKNDQADEIINNCMKNEKAAGYCQEYYNKYLSQNQNREVGFLSKYVNKI